jgi:hypothetical protein
VLTGEKTGIEVNRLSLLYEIVDGVFKMIEEFVHDDFGMAAG